MIRPDHRHARGYSTQPSSSAPIVQLAVTASRSPCGRRCAIGNAEPRHSDHSHGISAYEEDGGRGKPDGTIVSPGYGSGSTLTDAALRARRRWQQEQGG